MREDYEIYTDFVSCKFYFIIRNESGIVYMSQDFDTRGEAEDAAIDYVNKDVNEDAL